MKKTILLLAVLLLSTSMFCQINSYKMTHLTVYNNKPDGSLDDLIKERDDISTIVTMNINKSLITFYLPEPDIYVVTNSYTSEMFTDRDGDTYQVFTYESFDDEGVRCDIELCTWNSSGYNIQHFWIKYKNVTIIYRGEFINRIEKAEPKTNNTSYET